TASPPRPLLSQGSAAATPKTCRRGTVMSQAVRTTLMMVAVAVTVAGCAGGDRTPRVPVSGTVTLNGQPLESGQITFIPDTGENVVGTAIKNGRYSLARSEGPSPGSHRVNIWSQAPTGKKVPSDPETPGSELIDETREVLPARYNKKTELKKDIKE